ncbi:MAG: hypothetical protein BWY31_04760 [Lentisphaerae bacterium ADurb.Bin242]|nr:MAG: hypothetical protein BWY31_04760 [Lentisphaerae bacterium ADurb.Bin242]
MKEADPHASRFRVHVMPYPERHVRRREEGAALLADGAAVSRGEFIVSLVSLGENIEGRGLTVKISVFFDREIVGERELDMVDRVKFHEMPPNRFLLL